MAVKNWTGTTSSAFNVDSNWDAGTAPVSTDQVFVSTGRSVDGGSYGSVDLSHIGIGPEYSGRVGSESNPLVISADEIEIRGGNRIYLTAGTYGIDSVVIDTGKTKATQEIHLAGTITRISAYSGYTVLTGGTITELYAEGDAIVIIDGADVGKIWGNTGNVQVINSSSTVTEAHVINTNIDVQAGGIATIHQFGTGTVNYDSTVTITELRAIRGGFTRSDNRPLTITTAYVHSSAKADLRFRGVTITNSYQVGPAVANFMPAGTVTMEF